MRRVGWLSSCSKEMRRVAWVSSYSRTMASSGGFYRGSSSDGPGIDTELLKHVVTEWLKSTPNKSGNVFAAHRDHQELLDKMQRYMKGASQPTEDNGNVPLCGVIPLKFSNQVSRDVARHVREREIGGTFDDVKTSLLCNIGTAGSGQAILLHQTTVEAVQMLGQMVGEHVEAAARRSATPEESTRKGPLGFYVTFNTSLTSTDRDKHFLAADKYPILTAIALRVAYSVVDPSIDYGTFAKRVAKCCNLESDKANFESIIDALRSVWKWDGPMFLAIHDCQRPFKRLPLEQLHDGLSDVMGCWTSRESYS
ncbi:multi-copy leucine-rich repeat protein, putative [Bodo saltans]|uniref:Multi-copy leucine-rich repeat protein, putative n=1 Tax=Bodo saltans TaxID=75058 RepID=A0A0S4JK54_BODSA|nr:multi-copy leucine-rich repeat protein, putative [Bodo saltans]|eukprot:CUG88873.1 multi-copy leucine-rich repeat protein, putative [Bodo saltans]